MQFSFQALGTKWWIEVFDEISNTTGDEVQDFVTGCASTFERTYSRFLSDSLLSTLNRERVCADPSPELINLLEYGKQLYLRTDTHFNFLTGHILSARGYDAEYSFQSTHSDTLPGNPVIDVQISTGRIELLGEATIDLGGYGKGYLIDLIAAQLRRRFDLRQFLINGGGDMYATHKDGESIEIHLEHPTKPGTMIAQATLLNQGFAASSPHKRVWQNDSGTHNHIIADTLTADATFIKATKAADADAFATASLQMTRPQIEQLAKTEAVAVAQFNIQTSNLTATRNFTPESK